MIGPIVEIGSLLSYETPPAASVTEGVFADRVIATAILDRLLHHSYVINFRGESYRLRESRRAGLFASAVRQRDAS